LEHIINDKTNLIKEDARMLRRCIVAVTKFCKAQIHVLTWIH